MLHLASRALLLVQEEGHAEEEPSGIDLVLPETAELLWGAICFAVVFIVLTKVAFPAIRKAIEEREKKIQSDLESAESTKAEAQRQFDEYKRQVAEARAEANKIVEEARQSADQVRKDLIAKAEGEARQIVERASEQIEAERNRTLTELRSQIAEMSIELAEKVVGRSIDAKAQRELVDAYISEVGGMSSNGGSQN